MKTQIHGIVVELQDISELPAKAAEVVKQVENTYFEKFGLRALVQNVKNAVHNVEGEVEKALGLEKTDDTPAASTITSETATANSTTVSTETATVTEAPAQEAATEVSATTPATDATPAVAPVAAAAPHHAKHVAKKAK